MHTLKTIGFIGLGNMGRAVALTVAKTSQQAQLLLNDIIPDKVTELMQLVNGHMTTLEQIALNADCIFIGIKPQQLSQLAQVLQPIIAKRTHSLLLISMLAGVSLQELERHFPTPTRLIRMMPNTPIEVGCGMTSFTLGTHATATDNQLFIQLFANSGLTLSLPEQQLAAATGIAGCGPAFVYQFIEALSDAGVKYGLSRADALTLASQMVVGAGQMVTNTQMHPAQLKDQVCSPGGATIAGLIALEKAAFRGTIIEAVEAAVKRTDNLG